MVTRYGSSTRDKQAQIIKQGFRRIFIDEILAGNPALVTDAVGHKLMLLQNKNREHYRSASAVVDVLTNGTGISEHYTSVQHAKMNLLYALHTIMRFTDTLTLLCIV